MLCQHCEWMGSDKILSAGHPRDNRPWMALGDSPVSLDHWVTVIVRSPSVMVRIILDSRPAQGTRILFAGFHILRRGDTPWERESSRRSSLPMSTGSSKDGTAEGE